MKRETKVAHPPLERLADDNIPLVSPVHLSAKFSLPNIEELERMFSGERDGYLYSRVSNPTVQELERLLANLQGREQAVCFSSGVGAISCCLISLLSAGDHVVLFLEGYKPTRYLLRKLLAKYGVETTLISVSEQEKLESLIRPGKTKIIYFESPTNPSLRIPDIDAIVNVAKRHGIATVLDNTFAGVHNHGRYGVDIFIHSLSKFVSGHSDATGGAIIADSRWTKSLRRDAVELGARLDPFSAYLFLRGMKTYFLRYERQCANALRVAEFLESRPEVSQVAYPGLPSHPEHERAKRQMEDFGVVVYFDLVGDEEALRRFIGALSLVHLTASLGGSETLVAPAKLFYAGHYSAEEERRSGIGPGSVRIAVGTEHIDDIVDDLNRGLQAIQSGD